jgi:endonuclease G, mitochondrial
LPKISPARKNEIAPLRSGKGYIINYFHHSVVMNKKRKFAFFSASNINGKEWKNINRKGVFKKDQRAVSANYQFGNELYNAIKATGLRPNDFEQGHLSSFQEVLWGKTAAQRRKAADDTFYFTNCVPQHARVNAGLWRSLEQYILKTQTVQHDLKVSVITGPLLSGNDPYYIKKINGEFVKIPCIFWKVIYYPNKRGLNAVGFMMSHTQLLLQDGTVTFQETAVKDSLAPSVAAPDLFMDFKYDAVYQVKVEFIQEKTGLQFMLKNVHLPYQQNVKKSVLYKRIEVPPAAVLKPGRLKEPPLDYKLKRITL